MFFGLFKKKLKNRITFTEYHRIEEKVKTNFNFFESLNDINESFIDQTKCIHYWMITYYDSKLKIYIIEYRFGKNLDDKITQDILLLEYKVINTIELTKENYRKLKFDQDLNSELNLYGYKTTNELKVI